MLIKYKDQVVNLDNVTSFGKEEGSIYFNTTSSSCRMFSFENEHERDKAFEEVWRDYNWHRQVCNLDNK